MASSGFGFTARSDLIRVRRSQIPVYRDIRDRPVWQRLDTLYYNVLLTPGDIDILAIEEDETGSVFYVVLTKLYRKRTGSPQAPGQIGEIGGGVGPEYFWDGSTIVIRGYNFATKNVDGEHQCYEDIRITTPDNSAQLNCVAQHGDPDFLGFITSSRTVVFSCEAATGPWRGATNCIFDYDNQTLWRTIQVYRAINDA
jgi:hypothetical protein